MSKKTFLYFVPESKTQKRVKKEETLKEKYRNDPTYRLIEKVFLSDGSGELVNQRWGNEHPEKNLIDQVASF